jgi:hypothetical protein
MQDKQHTDASIRFELLIGVNPGYHHENELHDPIATASAAWHAAAEQCLQAGGYYIPGSVTFCKMVYRPEWGCPEGGEDAVMISGVMNTRFYQDEDLYIDSVRKTCKAVQNELRQVTAILSFFRAGFEYLD